MVTDMNEQKQNTSTGSDDPNGAIIEHNMVDHNMVHQHENRIESGWHVTNTILLLLIEERNELPNRYLWSPGHHFRRRGCSTSQRLLRLFPDNQRINKPIRRHRRSR